MTARAPLRDLIATVTRSLSQDVLPHVEVAWVAGNLRACIAMLTYIEDRAEQERGALVADAAAMRSLLEAAGRAGIGPSPADLLARIPLRDDVPTATLLEEDASYREAVTALVHAIDRHGDREDIASLRDRLRRCLAQMQAREYEMIKRAETVPPI